MKTMTFNNKPSLAKVMENMINDEFIHPLRNKLHHNIPSVNLKESKSNFQLEMAAPGLIKSNFDIEVIDGQLKITYKSSDKKEADVNEYSRMEFNYQSFTRLFNLPDTASDSEIKASYLDGILKINIPKKEETKDDVRKISID